MPVRGSGDPADATRDLRGSGSDPHRTPPSVTVTDTGGAVPDRALAATAAAPEDAGDLVGKTLDRYRVLARLGQGGMGVVYAALDPALDRKVALKVLPPLAADEGAHLEARLRREAQALARLAHPNVVGVFDVGVAEHSVFVAMQLIEGTTLAERLADAKPPPREILALFVAAARGLAAAHEAGIVHRDVKPSNILVDRAGRAYVSDFGLARGAADEDGEPATVPEAERSDSNLLDEAMTREGSVLGTPLYMAPEQHQGKAATARSDQFSFCVSLWQALFGQHPFVKGRWVMATAVDAMARDAVIDPPSVRGVPARAVRALRRGMRHDPDARWPSMAALNHELAPRSRAGLAWGALAVGGMIGAAVLTATLTGGAASDPADACRAAAERINEVWPARAAELRASYTSAGMASDAAPVVAGLQAYAARWHDLRRDACLAADVRGDETPALRDMEVRCLDQDLDVVRDLLDELHGAPAARLARGAKLVATLPHLDDCGAHAIAGVTPPPPGALGRIYEIKKQLVIARGYDTEDRMADAIALAHSQVAAARQVGYGPLTAEALMIEALAEMKRGNAATATDLARDAAELATEAHADRVASRAYSLALITAANKPDLLRVEVLLPVARAAARRVGDPDTLADFDVAAGAAELSQGKIDDAITSCQRALDEAHQIGTGQSAELVAQAYECLGGAGYARGDVASEVKWSEQWLAEDERHYGKGSFGTVDAMRAVAMARRAQGRFDDAVALMRDALAATERALGPDNADVEPMLETLAQMMHQAHHVPEGIAYAKRALAIAQKSDVPPGATTIAAETTLAQLLVRSGARAEAIPHYEAALALAEKVLAPDDSELQVVRFDFGSTLAEDDHQVDRALALVAAAEASWQRTGTPNVFGAQELRAEILQEHGRCADAVPLFDAAATGVEHAHGDARLLLTIHFNLASCLWEASVDRKRAWALFQQVAKDAAAMGEGGKDIGDAAAAFLKKHPKSP